MLSRIRLLVLHYYRKQGYNLRHVAIVGNGKSALQYKKDIKKNPQYGYRIAGYFSKVENPKLGKCLGAYEDIADYLEANPLDELVVALEPHEVEACTHGGRQRRCEGHTHSIFQ